MGLFLALALFIALAGVVASMRSDDEAIAHAFDAPKRLPNPGSRDLHTVTSGTLGRAHVPSWG